MKIIADSSSLYSTKEANSKGFTILPVAVTLNGKSYKDYDEITSDKLLSQIVQGAIPKSSQPAIGEIIDTFTSTDEEIVMLTVGDGLSGTYSNAVGAKNSLDKHEHIHIIDTQTLAGAFHYLVDKANTLKNEGKTIAEIKNELCTSIQNSLSYVIPTNFAFLKRSGRLSPIAANAAGFMKIVPTLTLSENRRKIELLTMTRTVKKAIEEITKNMKQHGVNEDYQISVSHAGVCEKAKEALEQIKQQFANATFELFELSPSLMLHGGPGCIVIQAIKR